MSLTDTPTALLMSATVDVRMQTAVVAVFALERGDLSGMSCAFAVEKDTCNSDYNLRSIQRTDSLLDVSFVS